MLVSTVGGCGDKAPLPAEDFGKDMATSRDSEPRTAWRPPHWYARGPALGVAHPQVRLKQPLLRLSTLNLEKNMLYPTIGVCTLLQHVRVED